MPLESKIGEYIKTFTYCTYCERLHDSKNKYCPNCRDIKIDKLFGIIEI